MGHGAWGMGHGAWGALPMPYALCPMPETASRRFLPLLVGVGGIAVFFEKLKLYQLIIE